MDIEQAASRLAELCQKGTLGDLQDFVDEARQALSVNTPEDSLEFMLGVCDALDSYDFGDYEEQPRLLHRYAEETLRENRLDETQQLRLLAHLEQHFPSERPDWPQLREERSRMWLEILHRVKQLAGSEPAPDELPLLSIPLPLDVHFPYGIPPEMIADEQTRAEYDQALSRNQQNAERVARHHKMRRLVEEYEPRASRYISRAFAEPPYDLQTLQRLLNDSGANDRRDQNVVTS